MAFFKKKEEAGESALSRLKGAFGKKKEALPTGEEVEWEAPAKTAVAAPFRKLERRKAFYTGETKGGGLLGGKEFVAGAGAKFRGCEVCGGTGVCPNCNRAGCQDCNWSGKCPACAGTGKKGGGLARRAGRGVWRGAKAAPGVAERGAKKAVPALQGLLRFVSVLVSGVGAFTLSTNLTVGIGLISAAVILLFLTAGAEEEKSKTVLTLVSIVMIGAGGYLLSVGVEFAMFIILFGIGIYFISIISGGKPSIVKSIAKVVIIIFILFGIVFFLFFSGSGASNLSDMTAKGGNSIADAKDYIGKWWNEGIECTIDPTACKQKAEIIEGTEDAGIEISRVEPDSEYFSEGEEIVIHGELEYKPWKSEWAIESPRAESIYVRIGAEDDKLEDKWTCKSPESLAVPDFTCTHPPFKLIDPTEIGKEQTAPVTVKAVYNFTTVGERKIFAVQRSEYYKKEELLAEAGYTEKETIRAVGGPAEFTIGANMEWDDVVKLPMTTAKSIDVRVKNGETGTLTIDEISIKVPTYLLDQGLELDCTDGERSTEGDFTYCTKIVSKIIEKGGKSTAYKIKLSFSDNFVTKGIKEVPISGSVKYFYGTNKRTTIKLSIPSAEDVGEKDLYGTLKDEFKSKID